MNKGQKTILILGAGTMQIPAIKLAKEEGFYTIVADGNAKAPGISFSDRFFHIDLKDEKGMVKAARSVDRKRGLDGVFTAGTDFSATVAYVAERLGLPGIPYQAALNASRKTRMRKVFSEKGIPSPKFTWVSKQETAIENIADAGLTYPLVVKPADNMGARGVKAVENDPSLTAAVAEALLYSRTSTVIIEEYLDGPEFSLDAVVYKGKAYICGNADRHIRYYPYFIEMGHTMPTTALPNVVNEVEHVFKKAIYALGITEGAAKGDIKYTQRGALAGEVAARLSGGYMSGWTFPYSADFYVTKTALRIAVGLNPLPIQYTYTKTSAERAVISMPGIIKKVEGVEKVRKRPNIMDVFPTVRAGDTTIFPTNNVEKCANVIACSSDRGSAEKHAFDACKNIFFELKPATNSTFEFIFSSLLEQNTYHGEPFFPKAYDVCKEGLKKMRYIYKGKTENADAKTGTAVVIASLPGFETMDKIASVSKRSVFKGRYGSDLHQELEQAADIRTVEIVPIKELYNGNPNSALSGLIIGSFFWYALFAGGKQGAVWAIDTIKVFSRNNKSIEEEIKKWIPADVS